MRLSKFLFSSFTLPSFGFSNNIPVDSAYATCTDINNNDDDDKNNNVNDITMPKFRSIKRIMLKPPRHWVGDGFNVFPVFADLAFKEDLSPLLMFDYAAPKHFNSKVGHPRGVGQHPHRGFETVTIAFQGEIEHHDNKGNHGVIGPGDVQWMTAGKGIIHQEYHSKKFTQEGGTLEMAQLWLNLPRKFKMTKPRYQTILNDKIPTVTLPLGRKEDDGEEQPSAEVRLIAGEMADIKGSAKTFSPVQMWDVIFPKAGVEVDIPFPPDQNCILFVRRGGVKVISGDDDDNNNKKTESSLGPQDVAIMHLDGSHLLRVKVDAPNTSLLVLGGEPLNEPIAARGPFVMSSQQELNEAMVDYSSGKF